MDQRAFLTNGPECMISPLAIIVRKRLLACPGEVLVQLGDHLTSDDVVARPAAEGTFVAMDVAGALDIDCHHIERHLLVQTGDQVTPGALVAQRRRWGLFSRRVCVDLLGDVVGIHDGSLFLRRTSEPALLHAFVPGEVVQVHPGQGASIRTTGAHMRCIWGRGGENWGRLSIMVDDPGEPLAWNQVGRRQRGQILVGGYLENPRTLSRAELFGVRGIIAGSIDPGLVRQCEELSIPVLITEGMGDAPMASPVYEMLALHHKRWAVLAGNRARGQSELIIPLPGKADGLDATNSNSLKEGCLVRLTSPSLCGTVAEIEALPAERQPTGLGHLTRGAIVRLPDQSPLFVPLSNLEILKQPHRNETH